MAIGIRYRAWLVVLARFINIFIFVGFSKSYSTLISHLVEDLEASEGPIGLCGSLYGGLPHIAGMFVTLYGRFVFTDM